MKLPPYKHFPEIISDTIVLRQIQSEDLHELIEISFYDAQPALTLEDAMIMDQKIQLDYQNGNSIHWGITDKHTHKIIGTLGFYRGFEHGIGEMGCVLKTAFRHQGYMTAAMKLAIEFGQNTMELSQIIAITSKQNTDAIKLLERLQFVQTKEIQVDEIEFQLICNTVTHTSN